VFHVPGAPLEVRWAWGPKHNYAFTATALTSKLWLVYEDAKGEWQAQEIGHVGGEKGVLPVDISLSADDRTLFVSCFADGKCRIFDVSDPHQPKPIHEQTIGRQVNMVSQSWEGNASTSPAPPRELGQARRRQRTVPARLRLERSRIEAAFSVDLRRKSSAARMR
jgi:hypothetical protein